MEQPVGEPASKTSEGVNVGKIHNATYSFGKCGGSSLRQLMA